MRRKRLFIEAVGRSAGAFFMIRLIPYSAWRAQLGDQIALPDVQSASVYQRAPVPNLINDVAWAHDVAARVSSGGFTCLMLALSARGMLAARDVPSVLVLGVRLRDGEGRGIAMGAHAWVVCGGKVLVGEKQLSGYAPVAAYVRRTDSKSRVIG